MIKNNKPEIINMTNKTQQELEDGRRKYYEDKEVRNNIIKQNYTGVEYNIRTSCSGMTSQSPKIFKKAIR